MGETMSFGEAIATQSAALRLWVLWLTIVMIATPVLLLILPGARNLGGIIALSTVAVIVAMQVLYAQVGFVRLLGLAHVAIWGPLLVYIAAQWRERTMPRAARAVLVVFAASIAVSLVLDMVDVIRWLAGDRASLVPRAA